MPDVVNQGHMTTREEYCKLLTVAGSILASALIAVFLNPNDALSKQLAAPLFCMLGFLFAEFSVIMCAVYVGSYEEKVFHSASISFVASLCLAMVAMIVSSKDLYANGVFITTASVGSVWAAVLCLSYIVYSSMTAADAAAARGEAAAA